jgi:ubiquitin-protein ligase
MSISPERIKQDLIKINDLVKSSNGKLEIIKTSGNPVNFIELNLYYTTASSNDYPNKFQQKTTVEIRLSSSYPFKEPQSKITTAIYHPNVYESGTICFGTKWLPTEGLDLLVKRIIQIITFDKTILNQESPANGKALSWYKTAIKKYPDYFPTDRIIVEKQQPKKTISWNNIEDDSTKSAKANSTNKISWNNLNNNTANRTIINCINCNTSLRLPVGKKLKVKCPKCTTSFEATT